MGVLASYIFVIVDGFSKFTWLYPTKTVNVSEVLKKLEFQATIFGNPVRIISDKGGAFISNDFKQYCEKENIQHIMITTGVPRGNGQAERINRNLISVISKISAEEPTKWFKHIPRVQQIINDINCRSTGYTPFELMTGTKMRLPKDEKLIKIIEEELIADYVKNREEIREIAKQNILEIQKENKRNYDKKRKQAVNYNIGDLVAIERSQFGTGLKLYPKFLGPYKVTNVKKHDRYEVDKIGEGEGPKTTSTSADHMKSWAKFEEDDETEDEETEESEKEEDNRNDTKQENRKILKIATSEDGCPVRTAELWVQSRKAEKKKKKAEEERSKSAVAASQSSSRVVV